MERRNFNRVVFSTQAELFANDKVWQTDILDLSLKGALIVTPDDFLLDTNAVYDLKFKLEGLANSIHMQGKMRHANAQFLGFQCDLIDIDSVTELRRLIELNLSDESLLHRDIAALIHNQ
ncbi:PilZ domain-containing protein [Paraglaciecola sp.]|uniref:PilZ domain-containing protein n=1 Tax=Paraglaciecola sp. TaxID=1920173 RepID=UPI0030F3F347